MYQFILSVSAVVICALGAGLRLHLRANRAEARAASLDCQLEAERHAACHDPLTGLPNRRAFHQLGAALLADPMRPALVGILLDLDGFKKVNDTLGHATGDEVLITVARRLATLAGDGLVARLGGDEFVGLLPIPSTDCSRLRHVTEQLADAVAAPIRIDGHMVTVTASIGMATVDRDTVMALGELMRRADDAMYWAKNRGSRIAGYDPMLDDPACPLCGPVITSMTSSAMQRPSPGPKAGADAGLHLRPASTWAG